MYLSPHLKIVPERARCKQVNKEELCSVPKERSIVIENPVVGSYSRLGGGQGVLRRGVQSRKSQTHEKAGEGTLRQKECSGARHRSAAGTVAGAGGMEVKRCSAESCEL